MSPQQRGEPSERKTQVCPAPLLIAVNLSSAKRDSSAVGVGVCVGMGSAVGVGVCVGMGSAVGVGVCAGMGSVVGVGVCVGMGSAVGAGWPGAALLDADGVDCGSAIRALGVAPVAAGV